MADEDPKTPPDSPPAPLLKKKDDSTASHHPQNSATYSEGPNIATLFSQPQKRPHDHQNRQAFYTGGSEHSGQQVLGPRNDNHDAQHREVKKIFKRMVKIMRHHHEEDDEGASSSHFAPFTGSGFTLGAEETDSQRVDGPNITSIAESESETRSQYPAFVGCGFTLGTTENNSQLVKGPNDQGDDSVEENEDDGENVDENDDEDDDDGSRQMFSTVSRFFGRGFTLGSADSETPQTVEDESKNSNEDEAKDGDDSPVYERPYPGTGYTVGTADSDSKPVRGFPVFRASDSSTLSYFERFSDFLGPGITLGTKEADSPHIDGASTSKGSQNNRVASSVVRLWSNGISIDDGPLRPFNDPQAMQALVDFRRNPKNMRVENRIFEAYRQQTIFAGEGNRLKSAETVSKQPTTITTAMPSSSGSSSDPVIDRTKALSEALSFLSFDQSQPGTRIQIRLADGSRIVIQINTSRLVSDIRQYIIIARPEYSKTDFQLVSSFPSKAIDQENVTIEQSGLANSTLVQHLI